MQNTNKNIRMNEYLSIDSEGNLVDSGGNGITLGKMLMYLDSPLSEGSKQIAGSNNVLVWTIEDLGIPRELSEELYSLLPSYEELDHMVSRYAVFRNKVESVSDAIKRRWEGDIPLPISEKDIEPASDADPENFIELANVAFYNVGVARKIISLFVKHLDWIKDTDDKIDEVAMKCLDSAIETISAMFDLLKKRLFVIRDKLYGYLKSRMGKNESVGDEIDSDDDLLIKLKGFENDANVYLEELRDLEDENMGVSEELVEIRNVVNEYVLPKVTNLIWMLDPYDSYGKSPSVFEGLISSGSFDSESRSFTDSVSSILKDLRTFIAEDKGSYEIKIEIASLIRSLEELLSLLKNTF